MSHRSMLPGLSQSEAELLAINHELELHQVELELQNSELIQARAATEEIADKYATLYDYAPVGYITLSTLGEILEINIQGSQILGMDRRQALHTRIGIFLHDDSKLLFSNFLDTLFADGKNEQIDVRLALEGDVEKYVTVSGIDLKNRSECFVTMHDVTENRLIQRDREELVQKLQDALASIKTLRGLIPICATCKKVRGDKGYWNNVELYVMQHSDAVFSHGICPECRERDFPRHHTL
ncbi:MAG: PAS domain-containing protein [Bacteroidetes bacterium]|nr:PAS domain-containing protein [Bacteroidota bacterium]